MDLPLDLPAALDVNRTVDRFGLWLARLLWLAGPAAAGPAVGRLLADRPETGALVVEVALWAGWFVGLVAVLVPAPLSLTGGRILGPVAIGGALLVIVAEGVDGATLGALVWAALVTAVLFLPAVGDRMINGSAYGSERRMALRPPGFVVVGPAQVAWLGVFGGLAVPLVLALNERWVWTAVAAAVGATTTWAGTRILHQLSRRWIVFVPAGFVIRDPMQLVDAILFRRNQVAAVGPAFEATGPTDPAEPAAGEAPTGGDHHAESGGCGACGTCTGSGGCGSGRTDLTGGARGLALEVVVREPAPITLRVHNEARNLDVTNIVFTPSLPGAMLTEARIRGLEIGTAE